MLNFQYDQEAEFKAIQEEAEEKGIIKSINIMRKYDIGEDDIAEEIKKEFELSDEDVRQYLDS